MRQKTIYTLFLGITLLTSSCNVIDTEALSNVVNAFSLWRAVSFAVENWEGLGCLAIVSGGYAFLKAGRHKQYRLWLSRAIAFFVFISSLIASGLFYAQYHEHFKAAYIIIVES